jgi:hypothetical protein
MPLLENQKTITNMNNIMDLIDFERRGEYVLADVKSATWIFERGEYVLVDVKSATWFFECCLKPS